MLILPGPGKPGNDRPRHAAERCAPATRRGTPYGRGTGTLAAPLWQNATENHHDLSSAVGRLAGPGRQLAGPIRRRWLAGPVPTDVHRSVQWPAGLCRPDQRAAGGVPATAVQPGGLPGLFAAVPGLRAPGHGAPSAA